MNQTAAPKRSLKARIKHHTPEIIAGTSVVAGIIAVIYIRKNLDVTLPKAFMAHAADPTIEVITGSEDAFVAMTKTAYETLENTGSLDVAYCGTFKYVLSAVATD